MRERIYEIIELSKENDKWSNYYDVFMMLVIFAGAIPLAFKTTNTAFYIIDVITVIVFILDYFLRLITADYKMKHGIKSFLYYPFTPMAIIDLIAILPSLTVLNNGLKIFKIFRLLRTFRVFEYLRQSDIPEIYTNDSECVPEQKDSLLVVCGIAVIYILVSALIILNVEPDTFENYFAAVYWATVSLTTMGYGDIYPVTVIGRLVTMISSFMGIAVVALPAGIITSGLMLEIKRRIDLSYATNYAMINHAQ